MENKIATKNLVRVAILAGISFVLMFFDLPLTFIAPPFLRLDISDVPGLIAGFAMGPIYGVLVQLIKNILNLSSSMTGGVGELSNFIVGSVFVLVSSGIYHRKKTIKTAYIGLSMGVVAMSLVAILSNYFVVFPLYGKTMVPMETIISMGQAIIPSIESLWDMMVLSILPFNLTKGTVNALVTALLYKKVRRFL